MRIAEILAANHYIQNIQFVTTIPEYVKAGLKENNLGPPTDIQI